MYCGKTADSTRSSLDEMNDVNASLAVWRSGGVVRRMNQVDSSLSPVSTGMGDRLWAGIPQRYCKVQTAVGVYSRRRRAWSKLGGCDDGVQVAVDAARQSSLVAAVIIHESFRLPSNDFDIAVFQLVGQLTFNDNVQPICLPAVSVAADTRCVVTGWGYTRGRPCRPSLQCDIRSLRGHCT